MRPGGVALSCSGAQPLVLTAGSPGAGAARPEGLWLATKPLHVRGTMRVQAPRPLGSPEGLQTQRQPAEGTQPSGQSH